MIYTLYGDDTYRSRKKLRSIIEQYRIKAGSDFNMHRFDAQDDDLLNLKAIVGGNSLFPTKKLSIIEYAFCERMAVLHPSGAQLAASKEQVIIMWDGALDSNKKKYLKIWEPFFIKAQEFNTLSAGNRQRWIMQEASERGIMLNDTDIKQLIQCTGDSWTLIQLLEKIATGVEMDAQTSLTGGAQNIFSLGDAFFSRNPQAIYILHELLGRGEDEFGLFSYLANRSRALVVVKVCEQEHKQIPSWLGIHPFVAKKTSHLVHNLSLAQCRAFAWRFFEEDARIKIGLARPSESLMSMLLIPSLTNPSIV